MRYRRFISNFFESINDINKNPILRTHNKFKLKPRCEPYLIIPLNYKYRQAISRIRASSHHLGIELGRHAKPRPIPLAERTCTYCPNEIVDDEFHFILKCSKNQSERNILFSKISNLHNTLSEEDLFIYLLSTNNEYHIRAFGKFLYDSFSNRNQPDHGLTSNVLSAI